MSGGARTPPADAAQPKHRGVGPVPALAFVAGCVLLVLVVPRLNAAFIQLPADPVNRAVARGHTPSPDALERLVASRRRASAWVDDSRAWFEIGRAHLKGAARAGYRTPRGRAGLDRAAAAYDRGLARSPGNAIAWMRLGEVRLLRSGPSPDAAAALYMSIRTAPFHIRVMIERLRLCLLVWPHFDAPARQAVVHQVRMAHRNRWLLPRLVKLAGTPEVADALAPVMERIAAEPGAAIAVRPRQFPFSLTHPAPPPGHP